MGNTAPNKDYPDDRATVSCKCEKVTFEFRNYSTRTRLECACFSCRQRQEYAVVNKCPGTVEYAAPSDLTWLDNAVTSIEGEEHLRTHILRDGSTTRWLTSTCCHSVLIISNPLYKGNVVAVPRSTSNLHCHDVTPPIARIQTREWSARKVGPGYADESKMPPFSGEGPVLDGRSTVGLLWGLWNSGFLGAMGVTPHREEGDRTIEDIMDASGDVINLKIPEYTHLLHREEDAGGDGCDDIGAAENKI